MLRIDRLLPAQLRAQSRYKESIVGVLRQWPRARPFGMPRICLSSKLALSLGACLRYRCVVSCMCLAVHAHASLHR
jgi:hypothetical protein